VAEEEHRRVEKHAEAPLEGTRGWRQVAKELAESRKGSKTPPEDVELLMRGWDKFTQFLAECLICFKNPAYVEEQEWRAIQFGYDGQEISFRAGGSIIIPYVELDICETEGERKGKLPIQCLTFGPTLDPAATLKSIGLLANAYVYPVLARNIRKSEIPYRGQIQNRNKYRTHHSFS
jgi:hypothetical protein